jgi:hypothetical protein
MSAILIFHIDLSVPQRKKASETTYYAKTDGVKV